MSLRGQTAIVGYGEIPHRRRYENRTYMGLFADAVDIALKNAGIRKEEINGLIAEPPFGLPSLGFAYNFAEYIGIHPNYATALNENAATFISTAAAAIHAGYADTVLVINGSGPMAETPGMYAPAPDHVDPQFVEPYGPVVAATGWYAQVARRHAHEYGTTDEQRARVAVDQRFNAQGNPNAFFNGQTITSQDVLDSRPIADPLRILECVMPAQGASATIVTTAEKAKALTDSPIYLLGAGQHNIRAEHGNTWGGRITDTPANVSARIAFEMAGVSPNDVDMWQMYDCYTITVMVTLEDAGLIPKGMAGPWYDEHDTTWKGDVPVNTGGGQLSNGQSTAGSTQVVEGIRQLKGEADGHQVPNNPEICFVNT